MAVKKPTEELVVLVDENNVMIGTCPKDGVHTNHTPLHRAFSSFLFNQKGEILLQQRSHLKKTWPLMWSNSCCGHPLPEEKTEDAIKRRVLFELGITEIENLHEVLPGFRYKAEREGIIENEICPVWVGYISQDVTPNSTEVEACKWLGWDTFVEEIEQRPGNYSEWAGWEVKEIQKKIKAGELALF